MVPFPRRPNRSLPLDRDVLKALAEIDTKARKKFRLE
jgi:hypothetical protein